MTYQRFLGPSHYDHIQTLDNSSFTPPIGPYGYMVRSGAPTVPIGFIGVAGRAQPAT